MLYCIVWGENSLDMADDGENIQRKVILANSMEEERVPGGN